MSGQITLTDEMVKEISGSLQCGLTCYLHKKSGEIFETMEGAEDDYNEEWDDGAFEKKLRDIQDSPDDYIMFSQMSASEAYSVMEDFARNLEIDALKDELLDVLDQKHPFRKFKHIIDNSEVRQDWFDFKEIAYQQYVRQEFEWNTDGED